MSENRAVRQLRLLEEIEERVGRARGGDPLTSALAAQHAARRSLTHKARLLLAYREAGPEGLTDEQAAMRAALWHRRTVCWWKRCSELRADGLIEEVPGATRKGMSGAQRLVCRAVV